MTAVLGREMTGAPLADGADAMLASMRRWCAALGDADGEQYGPVAWAIAESLHDNDGLSIPEITDRFADMTGRTRLIEAPGLTRLEVES